MGSILLSLVQVGIPVALTTYLLIGWLIHSDRLANFADHKELDAHIKGFKKDKKDKKKRKEKYRENDLALKKWLQFGGGFYGTAALYTFIVNEIADIARFTVKVLNVFNWRIDWTLGAIINFLVETFVDFIINSFQNFLAAILWSMEWGDSASNMQVPFNFLMAYAGYWVGARLASQHAVADIGHPHLWRWAREQRARYRSNREGDGPETNDDQAA
jgi:hypothetical protein